MMMASGSQFAPDTGIRHDQRISPAAAHSRRETEMVAGLHTVRRRSMAEVKIPRGCIAWFWGCL